MADEVYNERAVNRYRLFQANKPAKSYVFRSADADLQKLGATDFYELTQVPRGQWEANGQTIVQIVESRAKSAAPMSAERSAAERLMQRAMQFFANPEVQAEYDEYISWRSVKTELDTAGQVARASGGALSLSDGQQAISRLEREVGSRGDACLLLVGYCLSQVPPIRVPDGLENDTSRGSFGGKSSGDAFVPPIPTPPTRDFPPPVVETRQETPPVMPVSGYCKTCGKPAEPGKEYCAKHALTSSKLMPMILGVLGVFICLVVFLVASGVESQIFGPTGNQETVTIMPNAWVYCDENADIYPVDTNGHRQAWSRARLYTCDVDGNRLEKVNTVVSNGSESLGVRDFKPSSETVMPGEYRLEIEGSDGDEFVLLIHYKTSSFDVSPDVVYVMRQ